MLYNDIRLHYHIYINIYVFIYLYMLPLSNDTIYRIKQL